LFRYPTAGGDGIIDSEPPCAGGEREAAEQCFPAHASPDGFLTRGALARQGSFLIARLDDGRTHLRLKLHLKIVAGDLEGITVIERMFRSYRVQELLAPLPRLTMADASAIHLSAVAATKVLYANKRGMDLDPAMASGDQTQRIVQHTGTVSRSAEGVVPLIFEHVVLALVVAVQDPQNHSVQHGCPSLRTSRNNQEPRSMTSRNNEEPRSSFRFLVSVFPPGAIARDMPHLAIHRKKGCTARFSRIFRCFFLTAKTEEQIFHEGIVF
jgi:hypothetical protein